LVGLAELYRKRGATHQARSGYAEAERLTERDADHQARVSALGGLARVLAGESPAAATEYAEHALRLAVGRMTVPALVTRGWVALAGGEPTRAVDLAVEAGAVARHRGDRARLADTLELVGAAQPDTDGGRAALAEAAAIWRDAGARLDADRVVVRLGRRPGTPPDERRRAELAMRRLTAAGVVAPIGEPGSAGRVEVRVLGGFEVLVDDRPVDAAAWQSRKARDVLRILVARRGRPVARDELAELVWPDEDDARTGHRLSVLLSILRNVLDPNRAGPPDRYVDARSGSVRLVRSPLRIDVEDFLADATLAVRLVARADRSGRRDRDLAEARDLLATAVAVYHGHAFEDEPYADWAVPLREEARAVHLRALRTLAELSCAAADPEQAIGCLHAILADDPYDELAHRLLIETLARAGRHGESRRASDRHRAARESIGIPKPWTAA
jgi:DNA-binding SARP family transcriptional activator